MRAFLPGTVLAGAAPIVPDDSAPHMSARVLIRDGLARWRKIGSGAA